MEHLPKKIHQNGINYTLVGDYYIPDLRLCRPSRLVVMMPCIFPSVSNSANFVWAIVGPFPKIASRNEWRATL